MNYIGFDSNGEKLQVYDICRFTIGGEPHMGIIVYDEDVFSYIFEMDNEDLPAIMMSRTDLSSIEKIYNVLDTKIGDRYRFYRGIYDIQQSHRQ